ncbi:hypothetical protein CHU95_07100 [Niveispirillum lacus]|uniref:TonB-dependent siderophore receptor n=2 Tax=Niveispirillum lacus TaxID=1981099 RepID=A0A255Z2A6_9PROT|nr:hypothetical protein CHU95_07100 [Niveispirillum lacus]
MAQQAAAGSDKKTVILPTLGVEGQAVAPANKPETVASPKYTAPLRETPQTITVIPSTVIKEQNLLNLREILSNVPGITFAAGEGGVGASDSITMRGYSATSDIAVDGVRDSGAYVRSDSFNLEQVEVTNGANSVYSGSGSVGGTINLVSKIAKDDSFTQASAGIGTDHYYRATVDANQKLDDNTALRINGMWHRNDVPGRDVEEFKRWGFAPSLTLGLRSDTQVSFSYFHQEDNNIPQYGVPYALNAVSNGILPGADREAYYGYRNVDTQESTVNSGTVKIDHRFNDTLSVSNLSRWQKVDAFVTTSYLQGTWCLSSGINAYTGAACTTPGLYTPNTNRGITRDATTTMLYNQTDLKAKVVTGGITHDLVLGASISSENFDQESGNRLRNANGTVPTASFTPITIANPENVWNGPVNFAVGTDADSELENQALYLFDRVQLNDQFELNGGVRWEHNKGSYQTTSFTYATSGVTTTAAPVARNEENLFSWRAGAVFKPLPHGSVYIAVGNSKTPSQSAVNGACTATGAGATCNVDPETAKNYEIGTKWDLLDARLALTAALFRNERTNYKVTSNDPAVPDQQLDGKSRVDGVALGVAGMVSEGWNVFANYTYLDSEVLQGVSDFCLANPTVAACATALAANNGRKGAPLTSTPKHAFSLWTTYDLPTGVQLGYGATYQGKIYPSNSTTLMNAVPGYWVHRASASYFVTDQVELRLNVNNLFDKTYYTRVRNVAASGWATPGEARNAMLTVNYSF